MSAIGRRNFLRGREFGEYDPFALDDSVANRVRSFSARFAGSSLFEKFSQFVEDLGIGEGIENLWKGATGSGLTQRDIELNKMNMQNVEDTAAAQVAGYQKAGVNPALMYGSGGQQTAPQASSSAVGNFSDLMSLTQLLTLPKQLKMMDAQTKNIEADSEKKIADTEHVKQIIAWYPNISESNVAEVWSKVGLNLQNIDESEAREDLARAEKVIKDAEGKFAEQLNEAKIELAKAQTQEAKDSAAASAARAAMDAFELQYAKDNNAKLSSSSILAVISALTSWLGVNPNSSEAQSIIRTVSDDVKHPTNMYKKGYKQATELAEKAGLDDRSIIQKGKSLWHRFENWRNKEKRIRLF